MRGIDMRAASYAEFGAARDVLKVGEVETPEPRAGEVRVRLATSGVNPSDVKQRARAVIRKVDFPVIPHSDGAEISMPWAQASLRVGSVSACGYTTPSSCVPTAPRPNT